MGTTSTDVRMSIGGRLSTSRKPRPTVTAEVPSGRVKPMSKTRPMWRLPPRPARITTSAAAPPTAKARAAAGAANMSEFPNAANAVSGSRLTLSAMAV